MLSYSRMRCVALAFAAGLCVISCELAIGASLRTEALHALRARESRGKTPKTAFDGTKFHSILDHPSTARFFEGKDEAEIMDMVESVVFSHFVGHGDSLHRKTRARSTESELSGASFVQLAAAHGVDFATLRRLHQKSGKGHRDMEVWWREQALHPSVHVSGDEAAVGLSEELHASRSVLELSLLEVFRALSRKKRVGAEASRSKASASRSPASASRSKASPRSPASRAKASPRAPPSAAPPDTALLSVKATSLASQSKLKVGNGTPEPAICQTQIRTLALHSLNGKN